MNISNGDERKMKQWKITYWNHKLGYRHIIIEAETEDEATGQFMDIIVNAGQIGYCKTEYI
jgi:hypothetical protein